MMSTTSTHINVDKESSAANRGKWPIASIENMEVEAVRIPVIGLFSGAGGLEIGATSAGAEVRLSVEIDPIACQTLRQNKAHHKSQVLEADVAAIHGKELRSLAGLSKSDPCLVIGGPPCQPFSKAAYWTDPGDDFRYRQARANGEEAVRPAPITIPRPDNRRSLVDEFRRLVVETDASGFLFENVPSISHPRNRKMFERLVKSFEVAGYVTSFINANALDYGVPQKRHRVFLLGIRGRTVILAENVNEGSPLTRATAGEAIAPFKGAEFFEPEEVVVGRWAEHLREIPPGSNYKALTAWAGHPNPIFQAETRFWHFLLKLSPKLPSWTIPANPGPWVGPFHWDSRRLRIPELAALQGFPKGYKFAGSRRDRVRQVGNAVPPPLAQHMFERLLSQLPEVRKHTKPRKAQAI